MGCAPCSPSTPSLCGVYEKANNVIAKPLEQEAILIAENEVVTNVAIAALQDANTKQTSATGGNAVLTVASGAALAAKSYGVGGIILQNVAGVASYSASMGTVSSYAASIGIGATSAWNPATWSAVQFVCARGANKVAATAVNYTLFGVSAGSAATIGFAAATGLVVGEFQVLVNNTFIAKNESEKMSYNPLKWGIFSVITGSGKAAAAA